MPFLFFLDRLFFEFVKNGVKEAYYAIGSYADGSGTFDDLGTPMTNRAMAHLGMTHFF